MKGLYVLIFLLCFHFALKAQTYPYCINGRFAQNDFYAPIAIQSDLNVIYGVNTSSSGLLDTLDFDIYYPNTLIDGLDKRPLVVMVHGGTWFSGSKSDLSSYCEQLARRGYVAATIDYRLGWDSGITACGGNIAQLKSAMYRSVQDLNAALRYLSFHAADYDIDTNYIFLAGQSEGAWMSLHSTFMQQTEANLLFPGEEADLGGINNSTNLLTNSYSIKGVFNWCGGMSDTNIIQSNEKVPVLSIHGLFDTIMPVDTGRYYNCLVGTNSYPFFHGPKSIEKRLMNLGICSETNFDAAGQHCNFPSLDPIVYIPAKYTCFFKNILCGNCVTQTKIGYNSASCMDAAPLGTTTYDEDKLPLVSYSQTSNSINVYLESTRDGEFSVRLFSLNGQLLYSSPTQHIQHGISNFKFELPLQVSSGLYLLSYKSNSITKSIKFNINRN